MRDKRLCLIVVCRDSVVDGLLVGVICSAFLEGADIDYFKTEYAEAIAQLAFISLSIKDVLYNFNSFLNLQDFCFLRKKNTFVIIRGS